MASMMPNLQKRRYGSIMVLVSGMVYGLQPLLFSFCFERGASAVLMAVARHAVLTLVLLPKALQKNSRELFVRHWKELLWLCLASAATGVLLYSSYTRLATGIATCLHFLYPAFVALLCLVFFRERPSARKLVCVLLCLVGTFLILDFSGEKISLAGILLALGSSVTWALYIVWLDKLDLKDVSSDQLLFFVHCGACTLTVIFFGPLIGTGIAAVSLSGWAWIALVSAVIGIFGTLFFSIGVRYTDAQTSAIISTLEPAVSVVVGITVLKEAFSLRTLLGLLLVVSAVLYLSVQSQRSR